jgi:GntR family transcriptional regulator
MRSALDIDPSSPAPIWRQIEDGVRLLVASGALDAGTAVPSVRELAKTLRVNPATVAKAYRRLTGAGLLRVRRGEGTFVSELTREERELERQRLLGEAAADYAKVVAGVGASPQAAIAAVRLAVRGAEERHDE